VDYVYVWAHGVHVNIRLEDERLCLLVLLAVRADGRKELIILADRVPGVNRSWADLLRDAKRRGMRAPVLAVGDGALGFWAALGDVFPETNSGLDAVRRRPRERRSAPRCPSRRWPGGRSRSGRSWWPEGTPRPARHGGAGQPAQRRGHHQFAHARTLSAPARS
jgi:Transposase, Mutator family